MNMKRIVAGIIAATFLLIANIAYSQIYEGNTYAPSKAYIGASCSEAKINELAAWVSQQSCPSLTYYGKYPTQWVSSGGCGVSACIVCGSGDFYIGENKCLKLRYYAGVLPVLTPPKTCGGNPIDLSNGIKIQREIDIEPLGVGQIGFNHFYNNGAKSQSSVWFHSYKNSLNIIDSEEIKIGGKVSSPFSSKDSACTSGWSELKPQISDSWAENASARYVNGNCEIVRNNKVVRNIPIILDPLLLITIIKPGAIHLIRDDGNTLIFGLGVNNKYGELSGERGQLIYVNDSAPIAWRYTAPNGDIEDYDADGKLLSITASNGIKQELFYDSGSALLTRVKDSKNRELVFAYTGNQISSVTVDGNKTTRYAYNAVGLITQVTRPDSTTRIYHYEDARFPKALTGITDERGARYATWAYDAQGRAISSEHAGGAEKTLLAFNADGTTTVTNALNKKTIYHFDDITGARRVTKVEGQATTNCVGANQNYTYTPEGWVASKTDWKGIKTTFTYNALGQEISRTEAAGSAVAKTIATEWHATLNLKTKVTEPNKETTYSYDANGLLLNQKTRSLVAQ